MIDHSLNQLKRSCEIFNGCFRFV